MKRIAIVIGVLLGTFIASRGLEQTIGDGAFPLSVSVRVSGPRAVKKTTCRIFPRAKEAAQYCEDSRIGAFSSPFQTDTDDPFTGRALTVLVPMSTHSTFLGLKESYFQFESLAVIVEYQDGTCKSKVVRIPDGRKTRAMAVTMP